MIPGDGALAGLALGHRDAVLGGKCRERGRSLAEQHAAAGHDQWPLGRAQQFHDAGQLVGIGARPADGGAHVRRKEALRVVEGLGLHVLAHGQRDRAALDRIGQHLHGAGQGGQKLLGAGDPVPPARDRPEAFGDAHGGVVEILDLLQHRIRAAIGEHVARQEQHRQPVDVGHAGRSQHVHAARPDRCRAWPSSVGGSWPWRTPPPPAPCPARCAHDRSAGSHAPGRAPRRCRRRCHGRKSPSSRRTAAASTPSTTVRCAARKRTNACAAVSRTATILLPPQGQVTPWPGSLISNRNSDFKRQMEISFRSLIDFDQPRENARIGLEWPLALTAASPLVLARPRLGRP